MNELGILAVGLVVVAWFFTRTATPTAPRYSVRAEAFSDAEWEIEKMKYIEKDTGPTIDELFTVHGARWNVDPRLLKAIAMRESNLNPAAFNPEGRKVGGSYGIMQVLCPTKLYVLGWVGNQPAKGGCDSLMDPDINIYIGAQILKWNLETYGFPRGVAVYNRWAERLSDLNGPFQNQGYVNDVIANYRSLNGDTGLLVNQYGRGRKGT